MVAPIPGYNGGTGSVFCTFTGPTVARIYTLPDADVTLVPTTGTGATGTWSINISGTAASAPPSGAAGGSLTGTFPNPTIANLAVTNAMISNSTINLTTKVTGILPNVNTTATDSNTASAIVARDASGNFIAGTITAALNGNATTATTSSTVTTNANLTGPVTSVGNATAITNNAITNSMLRQSVALSVIGNSTNATANVADIAAASDFQVMRRSGTAIGFGSVNLASSNAVTGVLSGTNGGTNANNGSAQIIINGNVVFTGAFTFSGALTANTNITFPTTGTLATTANTVASITGTANQVIASASTGAVTLSLPQSIATTSTPTFSTMTLTQNSLFNSSLMLNNTSATSYKNQIVFQNSGANKYALIVDFTQAQDNNIAFYDYVAGASRFSIDNTGKVSIQTNIASSSTSTGSLTTAGGLGVAGAVNTGSSVTINTGDAIVNTAGRTLKIKQGTNSCSGTGAVMVAGVVTVNTTAVATGDFISIMKTAQGGTSAAGNPVITISNGVSFTLTGGNLDTSTWSWIIIKPA